MKRFHVTAACLLSIALLTGASACWAADGPFDQYIRPLSNPVYNIDPRNETTVRIAHLRQKLPGRVSVDRNAVAGGRVRLGGDLYVTAVQLTYAFNERFSLVAEKTGYVDFNPNGGLFSDETGWADYAAGAKYAFIYDEANKFILSSRVLVELTQGSGNVYQGNGMGNIAPSLNVLKGFDKLQLVGGLGAIIPFDTDKESIVMFDTWHASYAVTPWFFPLVELNHFYVLDEGSSNKLVPSVANFEGGDLINWGASNSSRNKNIVTMALGSRFRVLDNYSFINNVDIGVAYEFPLTEKRNNLMESRWTFDIAFYF